MINLPEPARTGNHSAGYSTAPLTGGGRERREDSGRFGDHFRAATTDSARRSSEADAGESSRAEKASSRTNGSAPADAAWREGAVLEDEMQGGAAGAADSDNRHYVYEEPVSDHATLSDGASRIWEEADVAGESDAVVENEAGWAAPGATPPDLPETEPAGGSGNNDETSRDVEAGRVSAEGGDSEAAIADGKQIVDEVADEDEPSGEVNHNRGVSAVEGRNSAGSNSEPLSHAGSLNQLAGEMQEVNDEKSTQPVSTTRNGRSANTAGRVNHPAPKAGSGETAASRHRPPETGGVGMQGGSLQLEGEMESEDPDSQLKAEKRSGNIFTRIGSGVSGTESRRVVTGHLREERRQQHFTLREPISLEGGRFNPPDGALRTGRGGDHRSVPTIESPGGTDPELDELSMDEEIWREYVPGPDGSRDMSERERGTTLLIRLEQVTMANLSVRNHLMGSLERVARQLPAGGRGESASWQKHHFQLDDGKRIELLARRTDGVLQIRLSSSNPELNRMLVQHQQEIRQHLERECDLQVELDFTSGGGEGEASPFEKDMSAGGRNSPVRSLRTGVDPMAGEVRDNPPATRLFGYNRMEWTG